MGDNVNLSVGQGDLQANPLQMAVAYAAIANGGDVVRPHVGMEVEDASGRAVQEIDPAPQRHVEIAPQHRQAILEGVHMAAQSPGGTSYSVFGNFPIPMAGKTGTAERYPTGGPVLVRGARSLSEPRRSWSRRRSSRGASASRPRRPWRCKILEAYYNVHKREAQGGRRKVPKRGRFKAPAAPSAAAGSAYE